MQFHLRECISQQMSSPLRSQWPAPTSLRIELGTAALPPAVRTSASAWKFKNALQMIIGIFRNLRQILMSVKVLKCSFMNV